ncbi:hypothetical protein [Arthrobacter sp. NA-172]|uniref:sunset domain-containing protein n=1 Tax=Arthrobacter sp. NA-172 TaxID=3367524 RepID=UPI003754909F
MDWLIWVIVIVLIVAIVWWLMSRNSSKSSAGSMTPSSPSQSASSPQIDTTAAALTGSAPLLAAAATAEQDVSATHAAVPEPAPEPTPDPALESTAEPVLDEPTLEEPLLDENTVSAATGSAAPEPELQGGVTADDVTAADVGPSTPLVGGGPELPTPEQLADSAEWEATWSEGGAQAAAVAPAHHHEYTDTHAPTLPGAESAAAEGAESAPDGAQEDWTTAPDVVAAPTAVDSPSPEAADATPLGGHLAAEQPYGDGSAAAAADGSGPDGYTVKGNADTMIYHDEDSPSYEDVRAEVWFASSAHAEAAGFRPPRRDRR